MNEVVNSCKTSELNKTDQERISISQGTTKQMSNLQTIQEEREQPAIQDVDATVSDMEPPLIYQAKTLDEFLNIAYESHLSNV